MSFEQRSIRRRLQNNETEKLSERFLKKLERKGHEVAWLSLYHVRIDGVLDFWPRTQKWRMSRPPHGSGQGIDTLPVPVRHA